MDISYGVCLQKVEWRHDDEILSTDKTLNITNIDASNQGEYICTAKNDFGLSSIKFDLNVMMPLKYIEGANEGALADSNQFETKLIAQSGTSMLLKCPVSENASPTVYWMEKSMEATNESKILSNELILRIDLDKNYVFVCNAHNSLSSINHTFTVTVEKAPEFTESATKETALKFNQHDSFILNCTVDGQPKPIMQWFKNTKKITNQTFISDDGMQLRIANATIDSFGDYTCIAENKWGKVQRTFKTTYNPFWTIWSMWGACSVSCGDGMKKRFRICHKPPQSDANCAGINIEMKRCKQKACGKVKAPAWLSWSEWSSCSKTCGPGQMYRYRECDGSGCAGPDVEIVPFYRTACEGSTVDKTIFFVLRESKSQT